MSTSVNPITGQQTAPTASKSTNGLSSTDFMHLMITQLQHQDPLNPTDSNALLQQISEISTLQSNQTLQTSLSGLTLQQSIGAGGNLIGKAVKGLDANGQKAEGNVTGVQVANQKVYLTLDNDTTKVIPMENITDITPAVVPAGTPGAAATTTPPTAQSVAQEILSALSGVTG